MAAAGSPDSRPVIGRLRIWHPQVGSTMDLAARLAAAGAPHGTVVQAGYQTAGRGRMGRAWETEPEAALLSSWILRGPLAPQATAVLSPLVALALIRAVRRLVPATPLAYKWPNDVLMDDRKLAGILLTSRATPGETVVIAGIGVNVRGEGSEERACLSESSETVSVDRLRDALATELDQVWDASQRSHALSEHDRRELEASMSWTDVPVSVITGDGETFGQIAGLAPDGALRLRPAGGGPEVVLHVGEIVRGPRRIPEKPADQYRILP